MKIAACISGQARASKRLNQSSLVLPLSVGNDVDYYCAMWDEPEAHAMLDIFKPKKFVLLDPSIFPDLKSKFFSDYIELIKDQGLIDFRRSILNGTFKTKRGRVIQRDSTLKMFYMMMICANLVEGEYNCILRSRPDMRALNKFIITEPLDSSITFPKSRIKHGVTDQFFYGNPDSMSKITSSWSALPRIGASWSKKDSNWLAPEFTLWLCMKRNGLKIRVDKSCEVHVVRPRNFSSHNPRNHEIVQI